MTDTSDSLSPSSKEGSRLTQETDKDEVTELRPSDVIMGRGLSASEYSGNKRLRNMVQQRRKDYVGCHSREGKQNIACEIIAAIRAQGGRFLRRHVAFTPNADGSHTPQSIWQLVEKPEEQINKVKQLLRDMAPEVKERRVQRRRRQAEWARQHAYTNLFPSISENPFSIQKAGGSTSNLELGTMSQSSNRGIGLPRTVSVSASSESTQMPTRTSPTLQNSLNMLQTSKPLSQQDLLKLPKVSASTTTHTTSTLAQTLGLSPSSLLGSSNNLSNSVSLADVQMLLVRQHQQREREQQQQEQQQIHQLRLLASQSTLGSDTHRTFAQTSTPAASMATPASLLARSVADTTLDPRRVLLELQRHADATPRMSLSSSSLPHEARNLLSTNHPGRLHHGSLDLALSHGLLHNSVPIDQTATTRTLGNLSADDLARLVLLERLQQLRN